MLRQVLANTHPEQICCYYIRLVGRGGCLGQYTRKSITLRCRKADKSAYLATEIQAFPESCTLAEGVLAAWLVAGFGVLCHWITKFMMKNTETVGRVHAGDWVKPSHYQWWNVSTFPHVLHKRESFRATFYISDCTLHLSDRFSYF